MRDPHVESLQYRLETDETTSYKNPPPVEHETDVFSLRLADDVLTVWMKQHFPSVDLARAVVEEFLRAWELDVALRLGPGELHFAYEDSSVIDRDPPPPDTPQVIQASAAMSAGATMSATSHVARVRYPAPSRRFRVSPDVETLWQRYQGYRSGREPLLSMAYFCLSLIETRAGGRKQAANHLAIDEDVLRKLGEISSTRGDGATARKLNRKSPPQPISNAEIAWTEETVKALIRRVAEADPANPNPLPTLYMSDLPPV